MGTPRIFRRRRCRRRLRGRRARSRVISRGRTRCGRRRLRLGRRRRCRWGIRRARWMGGPTGRGRRRRGWGRAGRTSRAMWSGSYRACADDVATYRDAKLYPGNGTGGFVGTSSTAGVAWDSNGTLISPGDVTGDGRVDVVFREATGPRRRLFLTTGNGAGFDEPAVWDQGDWTAAQLMFSPGDFSGDGRSDVIYRDAANANLYLRRGAAGGGLEASSVQIGTGWGIADWIFSPGDFSGDGKPDVIYRNSSNNNLYLVPGNGTGGFVGTTYQIGVGWGGLSPIFGRGDFSGDGNPDVIYRNSGNNSLYLVPGNGAGGFIGTTYQIGVGWGGFDALVVAGDGDGDGKPDVVGTVASAKNPYYPNATGDQCWRGANATIVWGGHATELVLDDATGVWRPADDDGSRVELLTGAGNGDNDGEYWRLTTTEGTQYFFGRNRLPGWQAGQPETRSAWTVPVFANHSDEPCFSTAGFSTSWCKQAWRWNLDHVVDPRGNSTSYWYSPETNVTSLAGNPSSVTGYERGGTLARIDYGTRTGAELTGTAAAQVVFTPDFRCLASCGTEAAPNTANWPDTPFDLRCTGAPCGLAPSFWSTRRLAKVTTRIWGGPAYWDVDEWSLAHAFLATGDTSSPSLWLASITHTGKAGGSLTLPAVTFGGTRYANRTDFNVAAGVPPTNKYRITTVGTGTGGQLQVGYEASDCTVTSQPVQDANTNRCFYQYYAPPGAPQPGWSLWNKYRVAQVIEQDLVGGSPDVTHTYGYSTAGSSTPVLWHHNDTAFSTPAAKRSWSTWRGYATVTVTTGVAGGPRTATSSLYFRGMHADRTLAGGDFSRTATITDSEGTAVNDDDRLAGFLREQITLDGPGGQPLAGTINDPWRHQTARRQLLHVLSIPHAFTAGYVRTAATRTRTRLAASSTWRRTQATTTFLYNDTPPTDVQDQGDTATSADDTCTHTDYARNTTAYLIAYPSQTIVTDCTPSPGPANHLSGSQVLYDGSATVGAAPSQGLPTKTLALASFDVATPVWKQTSRTGYDTLGRPTSTFDALDRPTTTAYTPANGGPVSQMVVTNALGHSTTITLDPAFGTPTRIVDPNNKTTRVNHDPLGRLTKVWLPGRDPATQPPDIEYAYAVRTTAPSAVTAKKLGPNGNQITSFEIYEGLLRPRQTQTPAVANPGRMVTDTAYDGRGLVVKASVFWNTASGPTDTLVAFADSDVARQQRHGYDNLERRTVDALWSLNALKWQTTTAYDGDRTSVTPPAGGTATTAITNARGKTVELRQYLTGTPSGAFQATTYTYDRLSRLKQVTDPAGNAWTTSYDLRVRVTRTVDPDKGTTTLTYDDAGQLLTTVDARNITLTRTYDALGRQTGLWQGPADAGTKLSDTTYDTLVKGRPTSSTRYVSGNAYTTAVTGYDNQYRPLGTAVTIPAVEDSLAGTWTTTTSYNVDGSPASVSYPAAAGLAAETVTYTYHDTGAALTAVGQDSYVSATTYYPWGDVNQRILGSGTKRVRVTTTIEEATRRLTTNQTHTEDQTTPGSWVEALTETYGYDPAGNVKSINETSATTTVSNQCFSYDPLRQLVEAWTTTATGCQAAPSQSVVGGPDPYWSSYRYDNVGNRTLNVSRASTGDTTRSYTYPAAGGAQPHTLQSVTASGASTGTNSYSYDSMGNTTGRDIAGQPVQTLTWDPEGHLATVTTSAGTTSYLYDAAGNRLIGKDANGATLYLGHTEIRRDPIGSATATRYCPGGAVRTTTGGLVYQTSDHHGTTQLSIKASDLSVARRKSDPFGNPRGTQPAWPTTHGYVGGTTDPTGLTHLGAREYDPSIGRFISLDPVMNLADPLQMNGYGYANNNPVVNSDPSGLVYCNSGGACYANSKKYYEEPQVRTPGCNGSANDCVTKGSSSQTWKLPHGFVATSDIDNHRYYVNGIDITLLLSIRGAPSLNGLLNGLSRWLEDNGPPGEQTPWEWAVLAALFLAVKDGYIRGDLWL